MLGTVLSAFQIVTHLVFIMTLENRYYYLNFTGVKHDIQ